MKNTPLQLLVFGQSEEAVATHVATQKALPYLERVPLAKLLPLKVAAFGSRASAEEVGGLVASGSPCFLDVDREQLQFLIATPADIINGEMLDLVEAVRVSAFLVPLGIAFAVSQLRSIHAAFDKEDLTATDCESLCAAAELWMGYDSSVENLD